jgi:hypothetical protein
MSGRDRLPGEPRADGVVVVNHLERPEILGAEVEGFLRIKLAAEATLEAKDEFFGHRRISRDRRPGRSRESRSSREG